MKQAVRGVPHQSTRRVDGGPAARSTRRTRRRRTVKVKVKGGGEGMAPVLLAAWERLGAKLQVMMPKRATGAGDDRIMR